MLHEIKNEYLSVKISDKGAELKSIRSNDGTEYIWQTHPAFWNDSAPIMFPMCSRLWEKTYTYKGKSYTLKTHGFASVSVFTIAEKSDNSITFELVSNDKTKESYPFDFVFKVIYTLNGNKLSCSMNVFNPADNTLIFSIGGHPGFNVPLARGLKFSDYYIDFGEPCEPQSVCFSDNGFFTGEMVPFPLKDGHILNLEHSLFDIEGVFLANTNGTFTLKTDLDSHSISIIAPKINFIGLWHECATDAPFLCIEPWTGMSSVEGVHDDFETKAYMTHLPAHETFCFDFEMQFN